MYSSCAVPNGQSNKQNGDNLWLLMETNGIGKRDSVLSKIIKSKWKILFLSDFCPNVALVQKLSWNKTFTEIRIKQPIKHLFEGKFLFNFT